MQDVNYDAIYYDLWFELYTFIHIRLSLSPESNIYILWNTKLTNINV